MQAIFQAAHLPPRRNWMLDIRDSHGATLTALKLLPADVTSEATHWLVTLANLRTSIYKLRDLPSMRLQRGALLCRTSPCGICS